MKDLEPPNLAFSPLESLFQVAQSPDHRGRLRIGGEAIPIVQVGSEQLPDEAAIARGPFVAVWRYYESAPCVEGRPRCRPGERWTVPATTEVGAAFHLPFGDVELPVL